MSLHHMLVPSKMIVKGATWKPTVPSSQNSFLKTVNGERKMQKEMQSRNDFCKKNHIKNHPVIFEITTCMGIRYSVCISNQYYKVESLIEAVDVSYKLYKTLNIDFPPESQKVWKFIAKIFYNVDEHISGNLLSIISDLNE